MKTAKKICFIDKNDSVVDEYKKYFNELNFNFEILTQNNAEIETTPGKPVDLIMFDTDDLNSSGVDLLKKIKAKPELNQVPVLVFSSVYEKQFLSDLYKNGASDYIQKPFIKEEFLMSVNALVEHRFSPKEDL